LIILDGLTQSSKDEGEGRLYGVGSSSSSRVALNNVGVEPIQQGIVAGICGYLLSEGDRLGLDITALLAECNPMYPDARAAALVVEAVSEMTEIDIPLSKLLEDARSIENSVREVFESSQTFLPAPDSQVEDDPSVG
jgi:predicted ATP-grasp superfamily ATP-dependent carboligase